MYSVSQLSLISQYSYSFGIELISIFILQMFWTNRQAFLAVRHWYAGSSLVALLRLNLKTLFLHKKRHSVGTKVCPAETDHQKRCNGSFKLAMEVDEILNAKVFSNRYSRKASKSWASTETVENISLAFDASPTKSLRQVKHQLQVPLSTVFRVLWNRLKLHAYMDWSGRDKPLATKISGQYSIGLALGIC